jgi:hypothetical protein
VRRIESFRPLRAGNHNQTRSVSSPGPASGPRRGLVRNGHHHRAYEDHPIGGCSPPGGRLRSPGQKINERRSSERRRSEESLLSDTLVGTEARAVGIVTDHTHTCRAVRSRGAHGRRSDWWRVHGPLPEVRDRRPWGHRRPRRDGCCWNWGEATAGGSRHLRFLARLAMVG